MIAAVAVFGVPFRGSIGMLVIVSAAFLGAMLPLGLLISTMTRNQFAASQAALIAAFLPAFGCRASSSRSTACRCRSGCSPCVLPARYFVSSLQTLFLAGDVPDVLVRDTLALLAIAAVLNLLLVRSTRMRLE